MDAVRDRARSHADFTAVLTSATLEPSHITPSTPYCRARVKVRVEPALRPDSSSGITNTSGNFHAAAIVSDS